MKKIENTKMQPLAIVWFLPENMPKVQNHDLMFSLENTFSLLFLSMISNTQNTTHMMSKHFPLYHQSPLCGEIFVLCVKMYCCD